MHCNEMDRNKKSAKGQSMPKGNGMKKGMTEKQKKLPEALQKAILAKKK